MKRIGTISCICSAIVLSACSVTTTPSASPEDMEAQTSAAQELAEALQIEYRTAAAEAREAEIEAIRELQARLAAEKAEEAARAKAEAEEAARKEAERAAEEAARAKAEAEEAARKEAERTAEEAARAKAEAEEAAREEAERAAEEAARAKAEAEEAGQKDKRGARKHRRSPNLLSSRARRDTADEDSIAPTPEQQEAARKMLADQAKPKKAPRRIRKTSPRRDAEPEPTRQPQDMRSVLRVRRFAPPEEAISRKDDDEPMPNSVELRGLRSPVMKGSLPMNIDGKINKED